MDRAGCKKGERRDCRRSAEEQTSFQEAQEKRKKNALEGGAPHAGGWTGVYRPADEACRTKGNGGWRGPTAPLQESAGATCRCVPHSKELKKESCFGKPGKGPLIKGKQRAEAPGLDRKLKRNSNDEWCFRGGEGAYYHWEEKRPCMHREERWGTPKTLKKREKTLKIGETSLGRRKHQGKEKPMSHGTRKRPLTPGRYQGSQLRPKRRKGAVPGGQDPKQINLEEIPTCFT